MRLLFRQSGRMRAFLLLPLLCLLGCLPLAAQATTGQITGQVTLNGKPVAGAKVALVLQNKLFRGTASDANGRFNFAGIPPATYVVGLQYEEFTMKRSNVRVEAGKTVAVDFRLQRTQAVQVPPPTPPVLVKEEMVEESFSHGDAVDYIVLPEAVEDVKEMEAPVSMDAYYGYSHVAPSPKASPDRSGSELPEYNREGYAHISENGFQEAMRSPLSTFSIDVDRASYANCRRMLMQERRMPTPSAVRVEEFINYFSYDYPDPKGPHPFSITTEVSACPWNPQHQLVHIGLQGKRMDVAQLPPANLVFLVDVSGSMDYDNKLPLVKQGLGLLVQQLRPQDRVAIVVYAGAAGLVLPSTSGQSKPQILGALEQLKAGGSTAGGEGIQLAYKVARENMATGSNNRVILCTDGDFNVGVSSDGELVRLIEKERETGVFLSVLGFGSGNIQDAKMEALADNGNGNYAYIDQVMEAKKVFVEEIGGTLNAIAKDVKLQVEFNPKHVSRYRLVGYENRALKTEDFDNDKKDAGELGAGHSVTAIYEIEPAAPSAVLGTLLRYQTVGLSTASQSAELLTVKFRYKAPADTVSQLLEERCMARPVAVEKASERLRWAAATAAFAMLLRNSEFKGSADYAMVLQLAQGAKGADPDGNRAEFIRMVETAKLMQGG